MQFTYVKHCNGKGPDMRDFSVSPKGMQYKGHLISNTQTCPEAKFMNVQFSWGIILRVLRHVVYVYNFYIANQFQPTFAGGGGGDPLVEVAVNSKEEKDFCPNYGQEFCLSIKKYNSEVLNSICM